MNAWPFLSTERSAPFLRQFSLLVDQLEESEPDTLAIDAATNGDGAASDAMASSGEASTDGCSEVQPDGTCIIGD